MAPIPNTTMPPPPAATDLPTAGGQGGILAVLIVVCLAMFAAVLLGDWRSRHLVCPLKCRSRQQRPRPSLSGGGEEEEERGETTPLLFSSVPVPSPFLSSSRWSSSSTLVDIDDSDSSLGWCSSSG